MPIDPLLRAWGNPLPAIIRDMRTTAASVGLTELLQTAVSALDTRDDVACRVALVSALGILGDHARTQRPSCVYCDDHGHEHDCCACNRTHTPDAILAAMVESVTVVD